MNADPGDPFGAGVVVVRVSGLIPTLPRMPSRYMEVFLDPFRAEAAERSIPPAEVERWISRLRPFAVLFPGVDGPEVGRWGGNPWLPADVPHPPFTLVASIDCAALPAEATDLPLPADGHLLLFANDDADTCCNFQGAVLHIPAGVAVAERPFDDDDDAYDDDPDYDDDDDFVWPVESLRQVIVPYHLPNPAEESNTPEHLYGKELAAAWEASRRYPLGERTLQLGGRSPVLNRDPIDGATRAAGPTDTRCCGGRQVPENHRATDAEPPRDEDWVLLATADGTDMVNGGESDLISWVIRRQDLAERRFDRVYVHHDGA